MSRTAPRSPTPAFGPAHTTEEHFLMGPGQLDAWLEAAESLALSQPMPDRTALTDLWRAGQPECARLACSEAGAAEHGQVKSLPKTMKRHIARLVEQAGARRTFDTVPLAFGLVPLDSLIVSQHTMTQAVVDHIVAAHPPPIAPRRLAKLRLPLTAPAADFRLAGRSARNFTFVADAHDMRFLDAQVVEPVQVQQAPVMGLTRAPCLIQPCGSMADLQQATSSEKPGQRRSLFRRTPPAAAARLRQPLAGAPLRRAAHAPGPDPRAGGAAQPAGALIAIAENPGRP